MNPNENPPAKKSGFLARALGSIKEKLSPVKPEELTEEDKKIARKFAKKKALDVAEAEHIRLAQKNAKAVGDLWHEFSVKLIALRHTVEPVLQFSEKKINPNFNFHPLSLAAYEGAKKKAEEVAAAKEKAAAAEAKKQEVEKDKIPANS